jgi:wobble nucleotide-excising tRNase|tara:strand:+ start:27 stop:233 length:207 start_codon:yes stop_codon:yes gene_type:complete
MKEIQDLKIEITEVKGDIKLVNQELDSIKNNHLTHIQKSIATINKILWTVGIMIFAELVLLLRQLLLG